MKIKLRRLLLISLFMCALSRPGGLSAQTPDHDWSAPLQLFHTVMSAYDPIVVSDANDTVHVFWFEGPVGAAANAGPSINPIVGPSVIYHTALVGGRWSKPVDIILSPGNGSAEMPEAAADPFGRLHLIWHGPNNTLYYSTADARRASNASEWSAPKALGESLYHAGIRVDAKGTVHVSYPGLGNKGVYYLASSDGGKNWSNPVNVAVASREDAGADYAQLAIDPRGPIHVVWTEFQLPDGWPPLGVFYARSNDGGATWSAPLRLAGEGYDQAMIQVSKEGIVHIIWNGMITVGGRYDVQSHDGGRTWSKPVAVIPPGQGGTSGYPDFAFDGNDVLHVVTPVDIPAIQYISDRGGSWTVPVNISGALKGKRVPSVERSRIAVSEGNRISVVFEVGFQEIYYTSLLTAAPSARSQPLPTRTPTLSQLTADTAAARKPVLTATPTLSLLSAAAAPEHTNTGPWLSLLVGVIPAGFLTILVLFARIARRSF